MRPITKESTKRAGEIAGLNVEMFTLLGGYMPVPRVKKGKLSKERDRNQDGIWREKRSDACAKRKKKSVWDF